MLPRMQQVCCTMQQSIKFKFCCSSATTATVYSRPAVPAKRQIQILLQLCYHVGHCLQQASVYSRPALPAKRQIQILLQLCYHVRHCLQQACRTSSAPNSNFVAVLSFITEPTCLPEKNCKNLHCVKISLPIVISFGVQLGIGVYLYYTMNKGVLKCTSVQYIEFALGYSRSVPIYIWAVCIIGMVRSRSMNCCGQVYVVYTLCYGKSVLLGYLFNLMELISLSPGPGCFPV